MDTRAHAADWVTVIVYGQNNIDYDGSMCGPLRCGYNEI